jgi:hypothetical protein
MFFIVKNHWEPYFTDNLLDMIAFYTIILFEYLSLYIKTDNIYLIMVTYCVAILLLNIVC